MPCRELVRGDRLLVNPVNRVQERNVFWTWPALKPADPVTSHLLSPREYPARLSLVIPMYNEEAVIAPLRDAVEQLRPHLCRARSSWFW